MPKVFYRGKPYPKAKYVIKLIEDDIQEIIEGTVAVATKRINGNNPKAKRLALVFPEDPYALEDLESHKKLAAMHTA